MFQFWHFHAHMHVTYFGDIHTHFSSIQYFSEYLQLKQKKSRELVLFQLLMGFGGKKYLGTVTESLVRIEVSLRGYGWYTLAAILYSFFFGI